MTRFSAASAAFMVFGFYMAMPPWPGVPEAPGPEHSFIVNKNLIEVLALLALACMPSGQWFGLDAIAGRIFPSHVAISLIRQDYSHVAYSRTGTDR